MSASTSLFSSILLMATLALGACDSDDGPSCGRLADHEAALLLDALPTDMKDRARDAMGEQRKKLLAACERDRPSSAQARCELAATDLAAHRRCEPDALAGGTR